RALTGQSPRPVRPEFRSNTERAGPVAAGASLRAWLYAAPPGPTLRRPRPLWGQLLDAAAGRARRRPVGRAAPGPGPADRHTHRDLGDHRGGGGLAAVDPAAAAPRSRHAVQRGRGRS